MTCFCFSLAVTRNFAKNFNLMFSLPLFLIPDFHREIDNNQNSFIQVLPFTYTTIFCCIIQNVPQRQRKGEQCTTKIMMNQNKKDQEAYARIFSAVVVKMFVFNRWLHSIQIHLNKHSERNLTVAWSLGRKDVL